VISVRTLQSRGWMTNIRKNDGSFSNLLSLGDRITEVLRAFEANEENKEA
jgi:hypothetical protein